jgi:hypothetical protein
MAVISVTSDRNGWMFSEGPEAAIGSDADPKLVANFDVGIRRAIAYLFLI